MIGIDSVKESSAPRKRFRLWRWFSLSIPLFIIFWYPHLISFYTPLDIPCVRCWFVGVDRGIGFRISNRSDHVVIDWRLSSETLNFQWGRVPAPFGPNDGSGGISPVVKRGTLPKELHVQWAFDNGENHSYLVIVDRPSNFEMQTEYGTQQPDLYWNIQLSIGNNGVDYAWDVVKLNKKIDGVYTPPTPVLFATTDDKLDWLDGVREMLDKKNSYWSKFERYEVSDTFLEVVEPDWPEARPVTLEQSRQKWRSMYKRLDSETKTKTP